MDQTTRELVLDIYDTVATPGNWGHVLDRLSDRFGALGAIIFELEGQGAERRIRYDLASAFYEQDLLDGYMAAFEAHELEDHDAFLARSLAADKIDLIPDRALYDDPAHIDSKANTRAAAEFGIFHRVGCLLDKDNTARGRFTLQYGHDGVEQQALHRDAVLQVLPHVSKALSLGRPAQDLALAQQGLLEAMDRLNVGVCIMDAAARIIATNVEFQRQVDAHARLGMDASGRLMLGTAGSARLFKQMFDEVTRHGQFGARPRKEAIPLGEDATDGALCIELAPLTAVPEMGSAPLQGVILYSLDTSRPVEIDLVAVGRTFGLTSAEVELADLISEGLTNAQIAERRARAIDTVRTQVKSVLAKTGAANRTQLVRLLSGFDARWVRD